MTQVTPPGWYPDPGHEGDGPRQERWWDGGRWTDSLRPAGGPGAPAPQAAPGWGRPAPWAHGQPYAPPPKSRRTARTVVAAVVGLVVLAGIGGGVYALTQDRADDRAGSAQEDTGERGAPGEGAADAATDGASGISLPVLEGWTGASGEAGAQVTTRPYPCPGSPEQTCVRSGAFSMPAQAVGLKEKTARATAEADIEANTEEAYGGGTYGKITSQEEVAAKAVTVAGQRGYLVRWKVETASGVEGYVQSLAFPSPASPELMVLVRFGLDDHPKAPKPTVLDQIPRAIQKAELGTGPGREV
ncbi:DUF2510 domain-containing protein [Streptomyces albidoflavus]|uniref:Membrane protein n=1 Tax=Streptomyces albidoflavus TaxID=1886 RepID=A0AA37BUH8_9ACTN|nr:DUF2510 domain-containing protein [Streptomyces albidoflavus]WQG70137.1 DUF2510 domain-containing protein [Streptomyces albidoflavus]WSD56496.1 DUF2510 domain-containing protein [Streptomyces albidoflavus]WTC45152.1 DUF2510 domain-containing protein [Streptomyces albidoflavus]GHI44409.1 membrane protein [Streptomyces albidoflavus]